MNDEERKILECAAKAAGLHFTVEQRPNGEWVNLVVDDEGCGKEWNPRADDGDAFRLMSVLHIQVTPYSHRTTCFAIGIDPVSLFHEKDSDVAAGRREAITLAAARLGGYEG